MARTAALCAAAVVAVAVILICAFACGVMVRAAEFHTLHKKTRYPRMRVSEAYPAMKTGDIVFFVAAAPTPSNTVFSQTFFSHSGVVLAPLGPPAWASGQVYLSEAQPGQEVMPGARLPDGGVVVPLLPRLKHYAGLFYLMRLARPLCPAASEALLKEAARCVAYPYPSAGQAAVSVLAGAAVDARHCFQHTAHLLDTAGLTQDLADVGFLEVCRAVCGLPGRSLRGNSYLPPVQLVYDVDC